MAQSKGQEIFVERKAELMHNTGKGLSEHRKEHKTWHGMALV